MTRWRENKDKRGVKATKYVFTTEQEKLLYEYGWELEQNISAIAKGRALKNNSHVTAWKKKNAGDIIERPEFMTLDLSDHSLAEWLSVGGFLSYVRTSLIIMTGWYHWMVHQLLEPLRSENPDDCGLNTGRQEFTFNKGWALHEQGATQPGYLLGQSLPERILCSREPGAAAGEDG